ncbi:hypothetical protein [Oharaeibacter diazotrophicus]|uniref:Uncharacterized protein n=1 Tax=Oharaeibacter diazotrophicus TaxID=1920512 RepID=A0A4R6RLZ4_9HYPH|nr:hypothetical protein [Oharaeibacter diazotrophicus]TDP87542.1 hypothetical protein EDD54_1440 [Oharaeibacter diazotrophicus]BBE70513.1 hypothetical protein OHA_1_00077 [Pleomorphomonas sp. SM30]GLS77259.1 hypothetical protein GCM10007904_25960 [Oharaeibacter diazotrophicus]
MARYAASVEDDLVFQAVRRPAKRASATAWALRVATSCVIVAGGLVLADIVIGWTRTVADIEGRVTDPTPIATFVGDQRLTIPANMFRFENQRVVGPQDHVELAVSWPAFAGFTAESRAAFLDGSADAPVVFLTIRKRDTATDSAGRVANVYQHFFENTALAAPDGLVGHRLGEDSGLAGEEVYYEAGSTRPFTTHCLAPDGSGYPAPCLTEIHAGSDLSVQIRFRKGLLPHWRGIAEGVRGLLLSFGVTA